MKVLLNKYFFEYYKTQKARNNRAYYGDNIFVKDFLNRVGYRKYGSWTWTIKEPVLTKTYLAGTKTSVILRTINN